MTPTAVCTGAGARRKPVVERGAGSDTASCGHERAVSHSATDEGNSKRWAIDEGDGQRRACYDALGDG